jgi:hypothetical protein
MISSQAAKDLSFSIFEIVIQGHTRDFSVNGFEPPRYVTGPKSIFNRLNIKPGLAQGLAHKFTGAVHSELTVVCRQLYEGGPDRVVLGSNNRPTLAYASLRLRFITVFDMNLPYRLLAPLFRGS